MKKILVVSDTHGLVDELDKVICRIKDDIDIVVHLGDLCTDIKKLEKKYNNITFYSVLGNCDFTDYSQKEQIITIDKTKIFLTHGSDFGVKSGFQKLIYVALERDVDICLFGHTHCPTLFEEQNIIFLNPGSINFPRNFMYKTYGIINIFENKKPELSIVANDEKICKVLESF